MIRWHILGKYLYTQKYHKDELSPINGADQTITKSSSDSKMTNNIHMKQQDIQTYIYVLKIPIIVYRQTIHYVERFILQHCSTISARLITHRVPSDDQTQIDKCSDLRQLLGCNPNSSPRADHTSAPSQMLLSYTIVSTTAYRL